ncbi:MAG: tetratricopeptide repeat protein [Symploca sp. SIO2D2]|nr:tetratricopeptide repeat protein [Symploca sp. SIO2D2]
MKDQSKVIQQSLVVRLLMLTLAPALVSLPVTLPLMVQPSVAQTQNLQVEEVERLIGEAKQKRQQSQSIKAINPLQQALVIARQLQDLEAEAEVLLGIGFNYYKIAQYQQALDYYNQALSIFQEVENLSGEATTLNNLGEVYRVTGEPQEAIGYYNQALPIFQEVDDHSGEATTLNNLGLVYQAIGEPQEALDYYNQALSIFQEVENRLMEATTLNNLGEFYRVNGEPQEALDYYNQALPIFQEIKNPSGEATTLNNFGLVYYATGESQEALDYYNQALPIFQEVENRLMEATTLNNLGLVYYATGEPQEAIGYYNQALPIFQKVDDRSGEATTLNNLGIVYYATGEPQEAINYYNQALPIFQEVENRLMEATTLNNLGLVYYATGEPQEAINYYNQALPIFQEVENRLMEATTLNNLGLVYYATGQLQEALDYYNQALPISQEIKNPSGEATTLNNLGAVYSDIGQPEKAIDYYNQALPILREVENRQMEATTLNNLGEIYHSMGESQKALDYYKKQALPIFQEVDDRSGEATTFNNLGAVYYATGQLEEAIDYYNQALPILQEVKNRSMEATTLNNLGAVYYATGEPQEALDYYNQALPIAQEIENRFVEIITLASIGFVQENQGKTKQAIDFYQQAIEVKESIQGSIKVEELKASFASQQVDTYERLINLHWDQGNFEAAFNYVERAKSRAFLDQLAGGKINIRAGANSQLLKQEQALKTEIIALSQQLITLRNRPKNQWDDETIAEAENRRTARKTAYENLLTQIKIQSPETASLISVDVAPLAEIQSLLDTDTTLIEYFVTDERTFAFIITNNSFKTVPLNVSRAKLIDELTLSRDFADLDEPYPQALQYLHEWLILPLQLHLNTAKIAIVPHNVLHYVPFAGLTDGKGYLSDDYALFTLPSASILRYLPEKRKSAIGSLLALGDPEATSISPLNSARDEVRGIASLFNTQPFVGKAATENTVWSKASQSGTLHLAAHGDYNTFNPLFSSIQLVGDNQHDGLLQVHEIYELDLTSKTNLVVLSACQTNIGELSRGDEVVGLNRAFLYAGTPTVMSSLWNVDDAATGLLMKEFYSNLQGGMGKAESLQQAQKAVRQNQEQDYSHPYYWAAFSLTGDVGN